MSAVLYLASVVTAMWSWSGLALSLCKDFGWRRPAAARWLWAELRPLYLPSVLLLIGNDAMHGEIVGWNALWAALCLVNWWFLKDVDEDDRWKRRRRKVAEKVARMGSRLVVVPVKAGAS